MTAAAIPTAIAPRVGALLRLLGSDHDGEALGAARALRRTLGGAGLDLHALAEAVEHPISLQIEAKPRRARKAREARTDLVDLTSVEARDMLGGLRRRLGGNGRGLTTWEAEFARSVVELLRRPRPRLSARQIEIVERLLSRHREG